MDGNLRKVLLTAALASLAWVSGCTESMPVVGSIADATVDIGTDTTPACTATQRLCDGRCVDPTSDDGHCGACGQRCVGSDRCVAGACQTVCPAGQEACASGGDGGADAGARVCALLQSDLNHCGACGRRCGPGEVCSNGTCGTSCQAGLATCAGADGQPRCAALASRTALNSLPGFHCGQVREFASLLAIW